MRNGGYKGIFDTSTLDDTRGNHTARDQFELTKRFDGSWFSASTPIILDSSADNFVGTVNADGSSTDFSYTTSGTSTKAYSTKLKSGKFYYEIRLQSGSIYQNICPITHQTFAGNYNTTGFTCWYQGNGNFYPGNISSGLGSFTNYPEIVRCAYDTITGKVWFGANDLWSTNSGDPGAGGSGVSIFGWSTYGNDGNYRAVFGHGTGTNYTYTGKFLTGSDITYSVPTGFTVHQELRMSTKYTKNGSFPQEIPFRIRLNDGSTRTYEAVTHQLMLDQGYTVAPDIPTQSETNPDLMQTVYWNSNTSTWYLGDQEKEMAAPNIAGLTTITGKTTASSVSTDQANLVINAAASGKVFKINSLIIANIDGAAAADITVDYFTGGTGYSVVKTVTVDADSSFSAIDRNLQLYLEEGTALAVTASANGDLTAVCSYEEIS